MRVNSIVLVCTILLGIQASAAQYTDEHMRKMISLGEEAYNLAINHPVLNYRCPHDNESNQFKFILIEEGYNKGLYSATIREELKQKQMYPVYAEVRGKYILSHLCKFGCFSLDTQILTMDFQGKSAHVSANQINFQSRLAGPGTEFFFDSPILESKKISNIIKSKEPESETLIAFELANGNTLKVTVNHGMVLSDGRVVASQDVKENDSFVGYDGKNVEILNISEYPQNMGVINFRLKGDKQGSAHIMAAEGVLVGDHAWQDDMRDDLNAVAIRSAALSL